jgi:metallophosphoesterase
MSIYTISDLHLSFSTDKPMKIFGGAWNHHEEQIKKDWLAKVKPEDYVILPGDHSWALRIEDAVEDLKFINQLPGTKVLLKGNHDLWWGTARKMEEWKQQHHFSSLLFLYNDSIAVSSSGKVYAIAGTRGWLCPGDNKYKAPTDEKIYLREASRLRASLEKADKILNGVSPEKRGEIIVFLHYPPYNQQKNTRFTQYIEEYRVQSCYYGHIHGFTDAERDDATRTAIRIQENGALYSLVSCDYTGNRLVKVTE